MIHQTKNVFFKGAFVFFLWVRSNSTSKAQQTSSAFFHSYEESQHTHTRLRSTFECTFLNVQDNH